jgi:uncharacterized damage-inducible protein DinB
MTLKDLVLNHLEYTFEKEAWQPSLAMAVDGLTARQAAWKPAAERHSIWQIVRHITHWKQAVLAALEGNPGDHEALERTDWAEASGDDGVWQADVRTLHAVSRRLIEIARASDEAGLSRPVATAKGYPDQPLALRLTRTFTHDIYHAGQIRYLRALQGV